MNKEDKQHLEEYKALKKRYQESKGNQYHYRISAIDRLIQGIEDNNNR